MFFSGYAPISKILLVSSSVSSVTVAFLVPRYYGLLTLHWPDVLFRKQVRYSFLSDRRYYCRYSVWNHLLGISLLIKNETALLVSHFFYILYFTIPNISCWNVIGDLLAAVMVPEIDFRLSCETYFIWIMLMF